MPVMSSGKVLHTLIFPWHVTLDEASRRIEDSAPDTMHWLLTAVSPENWIVHHLPLLEPVRHDLQDLERRREAERGGMRANPKSQLKVHIMHADEFQDRKVELDMTLQYFIQALALEYDMSEKNVLIMRGTHVPGIHEVILSYMPMVQVYVIDMMPTHSTMSRDHMVSAMLWQRAKLGERPWYLLPLLKGKPVTYGPPCQEPDLVHCYMKLAHDPEQAFVAHVKPTATISDVLRNLVPITGYTATSILLVKEGVVLATFENAAVCNPISYILLGDKLDWVDACSAMAADWSDLWSVSQTTDPTPRGGVRNQRATPQPMSAMLIWAEDKVRREVTGLNPLTVRMLLKAEQRTVSAVLHSRSVAQTREILVAAFRRAGLTMETATGEEQGGGMARADDMTQAMLRQVTITSQIAEQLRSMSTNPDFVRLLEAVNVTTDMQRRLISQTKLIMQYLQHMNAQGRVGEQMQPSQEGAGLMGQGQHAIPSSVPTTPVFSEPGVGEGSPPIRVGSAPTTPRVPPSPHTQQRGPSHA